VWPVTLLLSGIVYPNLHHLTKARQAHLGIPPVKYGTLWTPRIVFDEYQAKVPAEEPDLRHVTWLKLMDDVVLDPTLPLLDADEAAAISLAQAVLAQPILLDERKARHIAVPWLAPSLCCFEPNSKDSSLPFSHLSRSCKASEGVFTLTSSLVYLRMQANLYLEGRVKAHNSPSP
jgi:hypothetical protein